MMRHVLARRGAHIDAHPRNSNNYKV